MATQDAGATERILLNAYTVKPFTLLHAFCECACFNPATHSWEAANRSSGMVRYSSKLRLTTQSLVSTAGQGIRPPGTGMDSVPYSLGSDVDAPPMHEPEHPVSETASSRDETAPPWSRINSKTSSSQPINMDTSIKDTAGAVVCGKGKSTSTDAMPTHSERNSSAATSALVEALTAQLNHPATSSPPSLLELPVADLRGSSRNPLDVQRTGTVKCWCSVAIMHAIIHTVYLTF
jgi:hypothetical protein